MGEQYPNSLIVIRHAPADNGGRLAGRRDVAAILPVPAMLAELARAIGPLDRIVTSPALRCKSTAAALFPGRESAQDPRLWEQDFGDWEGVAFADLPDLGAMPTTELAGHCPPGGESFAMLCPRTGPALREIGALPGRSAVVAHAGTARAAIALALGDVAAGLAFEIAPLSHSTFRIMPDGLFSVTYVNRTAK